LVTPGPPLVEGGVGEGVGVAVATVTPTVNAEALGIPSALMLFT
jgi:hypothetical protein